MIKIESIVMGALENNVYVVRCESEQSECEQMFTFVVDPTGKVPKIMDALNSSGSASDKGDGPGDAGENKCSKLDAIICTHFHTDHTGGLAQLVRETGARVYAGKQDAPHIEVPRGARDVALHLHEACKVDECVADGDVLCAGADCRVDSTPDYEPSSDAQQACDTVWQFIHTPGHSAGGICLYKPAVGENAPESGVFSADSNKQPSKNTVVDTPVFGKNDVIVNGKNYGNIPVLFSGDTLFAGVTGRTDFFSSSDSDMRESLKKLAKLPDNTLVLPGHNEFTTIGAERETTFRRWGV